MSTYIDDKEGKARKLHQCRVCGDMIQPGETCRIYRGIEDGEGFYTLHFHPVCWDYSRSWDEQDWENCGPGAISRREIEEEMEYDRKVDERKAI